MNLPSYVTPEYISNLHLVSGKGSGIAGDRCAIQEVRAWLDLDPSSDTIPDCVCPVIGRLLTGLNDTTPEVRAAIVPFLPRSVGSKAELAVTIRRAFAAADWAVRVVAATALESASLTEQANKLRALAPIVDAETAVAASRAASDASCAASCAASDASGAASYAASCASCAASCAASIFTTLLEIV